MKFSLRDLFWLVLAAAIGLAWWFDRRQLNTQIALLNEKLVVRVDTLTPEMKEALTRAVKLLTKDKILSMQRNGPDEVEVMTGFIYGPLFGGGEIYIFRRTILGEWELVSESHWVS